MRALASLLAVRVRPPPRSLPPLRLRARPAGRGGNSWTSPEGCLMFSYTARLKEGTPRPLSTTAVLLPPRPGGAVKKAAPAAGSAAAATAGMLLRAALMMLADGG